MQFLYLVYCELTASTRFEHYLLFFRRNCIYEYNTWYIACMLCLLAAPGAAKRYNTHAIPIVCEAPPEDEQVVPV
jgi:hypothetical protein